MLVPAIQILALTVRGEIAPQQFPQALYSHGRGRFNVIQRSGSGSSENPICR
jgi:hypothetical protein